MQDEITSTSGQVEPPGMHMIYLPYCDDIRNLEEARVYVFLQICDFNMLILCFWSNNP